MKVAVTGSSGFLGSQMVSFLAEKGHEVLKTPKNDLRVFENALTAVSGADIVFHFAADMGGVGYFSEAQYQPFVTNILIDTNIFEACRKSNVKRLFYPSSACAYPKHLQSSVGLSEDQLLPANSDQMYGWEKLVMMLLSEQAPIDIRTGILHTIAGEGQTWQGEKAKFPTSIAYKAIMARETGTLEIWGDGTQTRTFLYIRDALEKIYEVTMADQYFGPVNISSDEVVSVKECADWCCEYLNINPKYVYRTDQPSGVQFRGVNNSKFNEKYAYRNKVSTKELFHRLIDWISPRISAQ